ncbi:hypothetical protein DRQ36_00875 [bacterium]|nr:MAG: hypothetical protein DRQ36_00875 [bacterium]
MHGEFISKILTIYCSAREPSNSSNLLDAALEPLIENGLKIERLFIRSLDIKPCEACEICYDGRPCPIEDDMAGIYNLLENVEGIILATPVYFYGLPSKAKALVDRCQTFWARKYIVEKPLPSGRPAGIIAVAGSGGTKVFEGVRLTLKYFLDAISIEMPDMLTINNCECNPSETPKTELERARQYGKAFLEKIIERKRK